MHPRPCQLQLRNWILNWLSKELRRAPEDIPTSETLLNYGMDSVTATMLVGDLEDHLGIRLTPTLLWDHPTVDSLAAELVNHVQTGDVSVESSTSVADQDDVGLEEAKSLLDRLDELTDMEVEALLTRLNRP